MVKAAAEALSLVTSSYRASGSISPGLLTHYKIQRRTYTVYTNVYNVILSFHCMIYFMLALLPFCELLQLCGVHVPNHATPASVGSVSTCKAESRLNPSVPQISQLL